MSEGLFLASSPTMELSELKSHTARMSMTF